MTAARRILVMKASSVWASSQVSTCFSQSCSSFFFLSFSVKIDPGFDLTLLELAFQMSGKPVGAFLGWLEQCSRLTLCKIGLESTRAKGQMELPVGLSRGCDCSRLLRGGGAGGVARCSRRRPGVL